ncbi:MAG: thioredoxin domain-containing protein [Candidatus Omnitrophota bacterium]
MRYLILFVFILEAAVVKAESFTNRLIKEKSPYLLQHAHNPVDWYPWADEAFAKAKKEDKPIFLSVGYSTCHWCHVMEEESYSNPEIAEILNRSFVAIKVDREERPDIDSIYMNAVQAMTGSGGWPLNVFLTPDKKPFYGGTYFPPGYLKKLFLSIIDSWKNKRGEIAQSAGQLTNELKNLSIILKAQEVVPETVLDSAFERLSSEYDSTYGGFSIAPKFPSPHTLSLLSRYYYKTGNKKALEMVENTLSHMADGGIHDHLGGGFHRYSTDREWFLPHFEKMLYDQAMLAKAYLEAYQITKKEKYAQAARDIFDYVLKDMTSLEGGFYSAEDADSAPDSKYPEKKKEGAYYVWTKSGIIDVLGKEAGELFSYHYGIKDNGNVVNDPRDEFERKNVLSISRTIEETAEYFKKSLKDTGIILSVSKQKLFLEREKRLRPHRDDKVLTDWNGLMISSLALGGKILHEARYLSASKKAADFILNTLKTKDSGVLHRFRDDSAGIPGFLADYAFLIEGLLDLYEATFEVIYFKEAVNLAGEMTRLFEDKPAGGFFFSAADAELILESRPKEYYDGALPSGNSMAALVLLRLNRMTLNKDFEYAAENSLKSIAANLSRAPTAFTQMLIALDYSLSPTKEIAIVSKKSSDTFVEQTTSLIYSNFLPNKILLFRSSSEDDPILSLASWTKEQSLIADRPAIYVCEKHTCNLPVTDLDKLKNVLEKKK